MAQLGDPSKTIPPFPSIAGGFSSFSRANLTQHIPRYQPEIAAPLPPSGATLRNSTDLLAHPVRGIVPATVPKKKRRSAAKPDHFVPNVKGRKKSQQGKEEEIVDEELQGELEGEEEAEEQITSTRRIVTRSRARGSSTNTRGSKKKRARSESELELEDCGNESEENIDRSSDEDFM